MRSTDPGAPRLTPAWRYGLVGGLASIPLTAVHWLSETANELSLNMVREGGGLARDEAGAPPDSRRRELSPVTSRFRLRGR
jgi:hypothetical protein